MSTVVRRVFRSVPERNSVATWTSIVDLLTQGKGEAVRNELLQVAGIVSSLIADQTPRESPITVTCDGPRTRIYCLYDDDATEGSDTNEEPLGFDPLKGDWRISLPCLAEDLAWVQAALQQLNGRFTARNLGDTVPDQEQGSKKSRDLVFSPEGFLNP